MATVAAPQVELIGSRPDGRQDALLRQMRKRFQAAEEYEHKNRLAQVDDLKFRAGQQWREVEEQRRISAGRPCLTVNTLPQYERQVTNEMRQNMPAITVLPVGNGADVETAKLLKGLVRHVDQASNGKAVRQQAYDSAVRIGAGYWRLVLEYDDWLSFDQEPRLAGIRNPFQVYLDHAGQKSTGQDAQWGFVFEHHDREAFEEEWGVDAAAMSLWQATGDQWVFAEHVRVAEYFWRDRQRMTLAQLQDRSVRLLEPELLAQVAMLEQQGLHPGRYQEYVARLLTPSPRWAPLLPWIREQSQVAYNYLSTFYPQEVAAMLHALMADMVGQIVQVRPTEHELIRWVKTNGYVILEESIWPGKYIPLIRVIGEEIDLENEVIRSGIIRHAKDPMRLENYWMPLALDTPVPTPDGWTTIGEVDTGDTVFDEQGVPCEVLGRSPIHEDRACYRVHFDDGSSLVADAEHPWRVEERGKPIEGGFCYTMETLPTSALQPGVHSIVTAKPLDVPKQDLPIHPYVLGVWLGDGTAHCPELTLGMQDLQPMCEALEHCGVSLGPIRPDSATVRRVTLLGLRKAFANLGLLDNKHIPLLYLRASYEQRLALFQGLMDTDGTMNKMGQCDFTTSSLLLRDGMAELLRTLGIKAKWYTRQRKPQVFPNGHIYQAAPCYQFAFSLADATPIFRLPRKAARQLRSRPFHPRRTQRHRIVAVEPVPSVPVRCIAVASASHLFLAGRSMIPTHNTMQAEHVALSPVPPWLLTPNQIAGYEQYWDQSNTTPYAYLPYNPDAARDGSPVPPPVRQAFEPPVQAITVALQVTQQYTQNALGIHQGNVGAPSQERSGIAIANKDKQADTGTFHYADNLAQAMHYEGLQLVDLLPKVLTPGKVQRIVGDDGSPQQIMLTNRQQGIEPPPQLPSGLAGFYDTSTGTFDVVVELGPSYATKRQEAAQQMLELTRALPQAMGPVIHRVVGVMDWDGASELADLLKQLPGQILGDPGTNKDALFAQLKQQFGQLVQQLQAMNAHTQQVEQEAGLLARENQELKAGFAIDRQKLALDAQAEQNDYKIALAKLELDNKRLALERDTAHAELQLKAAAQEQRAPEREEPVPQEDHTSTEG